MNYKGDKKESDPENAALNLPKSHQARSHGHIRPCKDKRRVPKDQPPHLLRWLGFARLEVCMAALETA